MLYPSGKGAARLAALLLLASTPFPAFSSDAAPLTGQALIAQGAQVARHRQTNRVSFLGTAAGQALAIPSKGAAASPADGAMAALQAYGSLFGLGDPRAEMAVRGITSAGGDRSVVRYQQTYRGIPVIGGELNVNLQGNDRLLSINGEISPRLVLATKPAITAQQAGETALSAVAKWHRTATDRLAVSLPELAVYDPQLLGPGTAPASLVWRMEVSSTELSPIRELVLVDAQRGHVSLHFNQIDTVKNRATYTSGETAALPGTLVCDETDPTCAAGTTAGDTDAVDAHQFAGDTYDFYSTRHGRDSIDDAGMALISSVHWTDGSTCPNAFWDGSQMVYCTGLVVDDVVAHELTHGVTQNTSNLFYYYQSGAINESLSDLWGEFVDLTNTSGTDDAASRWLMGEDATILGGAIRSMSDPTLYGDPDKMSSANYWTGSADNGGVHINSGINNKAVYLMVDGDTFNGTTVTGIGIDKAAKIYYEVQTHLLTSGADYLDLYNALYQGCQNLLETAGITAADCNQVRAATQAVEMDQEPSVGFNPEAALCPAGETVASTLFSDDLESGLGNWTMSNPVSSENWEAWSTTIYEPIYGPYATSGIESLFGDNIDVASDQRAAFGFTLPAASQYYLHFKHAFDFETPNYDGGVVEYSANGGASWIDAGILIDAGQAYSGTIAAGEGNPLSSRNAFVGTSHGYTSSRLNLATLAGSTVQFRWRLGTDNSIAGPWGWFLDDVRVYTCAATSTLAFASASFSVNEGGTSQTITVSRTGNSTGAASVSYAATSGTATAGSDFTAASGTLSWADGDGEAKSFTVDISEDDIYEGDETVNLILSSPSGAILGDIPIASLAIHDNDPAPVIAFSNATYSVSEADGSATITVTRSLNSEPTITVNYQATAGTATAGSDFTATSGTLSWADGDGAAKSFTVPLLNDTTHENDETLTLTLSNPTGGASLGTPASATLTIIDDDPVPTGGGGGGAFGWAFLLFGLLLQLVRHPVVTDARRAKA
jgi:Zn-dependent metalloprotease